MGTISGANLVSDGLIYSLDAANFRSYSGSGLTSNALVGGIGATLVNGVGFGTSNAGYFIFDGTNDYINCGNIFSFTSENFSFSYWVYINSLTTNQPTQGPVPYYKGDYQIEGFYSQLNLDGSYIFSTNQGGSSQFTSIAAGTLSTASWYHMCDVRNGSSVRIYVNGIDRTSSAVSHTNPSFSTKDFYIGAYKTFIFSNIRISNFNTYNRALSAAEIKQNYNATKKRYGL